MSPSRCDFSDFKNLLFDSTLRRSSSIVRLVVVLNNTLRSTNVPLCLCWFLTSSLHKFSLLLLLVCNKVHFRSLFQLSQYSLLLLELGLASLLSELPLFLSCSFVFESGLLHTLLCRLLPLLFLLL